MPCQLNFFRVIPALADKASQKCRAAAYRLIRHILIDANSIKHIGEQTLDWYIIKYVYFSFTFYSADHGQGL
jgi:3-deoxy-D-manno-octulosonate 8-phosphate phosphatase KdsC-like HAD superfamily phosphatase